MIKELFKERCLEKYRLFDKFWTISIDITGLAPFRDKHFDHCLIRKYRNKNTEKITYFHYVL